MRKSLGILLYRFSHHSQTGNREKKNLEVFLVHPGGPFFTKKDKGAWSIPKGLGEETEREIDAARREFAEETGHNLNAPEKDFIDLGEVKQKGGKIVRCFAIEGDLPGNYTHNSNTFEMEWPPKSGKKTEFPEADQAEFFSLEEASGKINPAQKEFLDRLLEKIEGA